MFDYFFFSFHIDEFFLLLLFSFIHDILCRITAFGVLHGSKQVTSLIKFRVLTSLLTSHVSCLSQLARQNFPKPLKIEQIRSHK